jgi:hypothetical protein
VFCVFVFLLSTFYVTDVFESFFREHFTIGIRVGIRIISDSGITISVADIVLPVLCDVNIVIIFMYRRTEFGESIQYEVHATFTRRFQQADKTNGHAFRQRMCKVRGQFI